MTTYFLRNTALADTLMQMGRFFGYEDAYALGPWIPHNIHARRYFWNVLPGCWS